VKPGQAAVEVSGLAAPLRAGGYEAFGAALVSVPWSATSGVRLRVGVQAGDHGGFGLRDSNLQVSHLLVNRPDLLLRGRLGASLPLGTLGTTISVAPGASRSVDPTLGLDLVTGGTWLGVFGLEGRVPVYEGSDDVRQGAFGRLDARGARRVGGWAVPWAGLSVSTQAPSSLDSGDFVELAATAGAMFNLAERWGLSVQVRAPVTGAPWPTPYAVAGGVGVSRVLGGGEAEEEHHDGDGH